MIITKEMFDEFVESAENHNILWTDTLAQWRARYTPNAPTLPATLPPDVRHFLERI